MHRVAQVAYYREQNPGALPDIQTGLLTREEAMQNKDCIVELS